MVDRKFGEEGKDIEELVNEFWNNFIGSLEGYERWDEREPGLGQGSTQYHENYDVWRIESRGLTCWEFI